MSRIGIGKRQRLYNLSLQLEDEQSESRGSIARVEPYFIKRTQLQQHSITRRRGCSSHVHTTRDITRATRRRGMKCWLVPADSTEERERDAWDRELCEGASHDNACVYPRDDVNTPHESTRLLGRGGRAAQFGCSRSSLVTRRNSAQVVLLCGECGGTGASTYDLPLPARSPYLSALFVFSTLLRLPFAPLTRSQFLPLFASCHNFLLFFLPSAFSFLTPPTIVLHPSSSSHQLTD